MEHIYPSFYKTFRCSASRCPDNCCFGWGVVVDDDTAAFYESLDTPLGHDLRKAMMIDEDGDRVFRMDSGHCPLLTADNLCRVELELGHEAPCATCRKFPRLTQDYGSFIEYGLTMACPEAARLMLLEQSSWSLETEISQEAAEPSDYDRDFLQELLEVRQQLLSLTWDPEIAPPQALSLCLSLGRWYQSCVDGVAVAPWEKAPLPCQPGDLSSLLQAHLDLEILTEQWRDLLSQGLSHAADPLPELPESPMLRNLITYYLYHYWLQAVSDYEPCLRLQLLAVHWIVVRHLAQVHLAVDGQLQPEQLIRLFQLYSKEVEHDSVNRDELMDLLAEDPRFSPEALTGLL